MDSFSIIDHMNDYRGDILDDTQPYKDSDEEVKPMTIEDLPNDAGSVKEISDRIKSLSNTSHNMNHMNPNKRDIVDYTQPYKESDEEVTATKSEDLPNDAGSMKEISDRIESLANIIHDMNDYQRNIFDNTRIELISNREEAISHSRVYAILTDEKNKRVFVAFRGTQSPADVHRDANLIFVSGYKDSLPLG